MKMTVYGIHHITALAGDAQQNIDFYAGLLGLRMVKKTVNFDDPFTYHFYFGDHAGAPGTIITFFPWSKRSLQGRTGTGQVCRTAFCIPPNAADYWQERFRKYDIEFEGPVNRFDEEVISFRDPDGLQLELVNSGMDEGPGWENGDVPPDFAIRGFHSAALSLKDYERTAQLLTEGLGFRKTAESEKRFRYEVGAGGPGNMVDLLHQPDAPTGTMGIGTIHHIAWRIPDKEMQLRLRASIAGLGFHVTPVLDRNYFESIYFREPGYVLFEVATDPPGFTVDEPIASLGMELKLPAWLEPRRAEIEQHLAPVRS